MLFPRSESHVSRPYFTEFYQKYRFGSRSVRRVDPDTLFLIGSPSSYFSLFSSTFAKRYAGGTRRGGGKRCRKQNRVARACELALVRALCTFERDRGDKRGGGEGGRDGASTCAKSPADKGSKSRSLAISGATIYRRESHRVFSAPRYYIDMHRHDRDVGNVSRLLKGLRAVRGPRNRDLWRIFF